MSAPTAQDRCAALVAGLREAADYFEAHPDAQVPVGVRMYVCAAAGRPQGERFAAVHDAAAAMGTPVTVEQSRGRSTKRAFGPSGAVELTVFAPADAHPAAGALVTRAQDPGAVAS